MISHTHELSESFILSRKQNINSQINKVRPTSNKIISTKYSNLSIMTSCCNISLSQIEDLPKGLFYYPLKSNFNTEIILEKDKNTGLSYFNDNMVEKVEKLEEKVFVHEYSLIRICSLLQLIQKYLNLKKINPQLKVSEFLKEIILMEKTYLKASLNIDELDENVLDSLYEVDDMIGYLNNHLFPGQSDL